MREIKISDRDANQRLDKYLNKYFKNASMGFLYKMLRKKNITLNGKKASGNEMLQSKDVIKVFFSEETFEKMQGADQTSDLYDSLLQLKTFSPEILFENDDILAVNKPAGILSQKTDPSDVSMNEVILHDLMVRGIVTKESFSVFHPSVANRLDRNTTGILLAGKTLKGQQYLSKVLKDRNLTKIYHCIVAGEITQPAFLKGYLCKDELTNKVSVSKEELPGSKYIETEYVPLFHQRDMSLLQVHLITGRSHQIRAHLAGIGHPVVGDRKYGDPKINAAFERKYRIRYQMLHAYEMQLGDGTMIRAPYPEMFQKIVNDMAR